MPVENTLRDDLASSVEEQQPESHRSHRGSDGFYANPPAKALTDDEDYDSMTKAELVALADSRGVDSSGTKAEIAAALRGE